MSSDSAALIWTYSGSVPIPGNIRSEMQGQRPTAGNTNLTRSGRCWKGISGAFDRNGETKCMFFREPFNAIPLSVFIK